MSNYSTANKLLTGAGFILTPSGDKFKLNGGRKTPLQELFDKGLSETLRDLAIEHGETSLLTMKSSEFSLWLTKFAEFLRAKRRSSLSAGKNGMVIEVLRSMEDGSPVLFNKAKNLVISPVELSVSCYQQRPDVKEAWKDLVSDAMECRHVFDISRPDTSWVGRYDGLTVSTDEVRYLNMSSPAPWRKTDSDDYENKLPDLCEQFFNHLIPDEKERHVFYSWVHNAIVSSNASCLVLSGMSATGKTIVANDIMPAIMGRHCSKPAPAGFLDSDWNIALRYTRFMSHDEVSLATTQKLNQMKSYLNNQLILNEKHVNSKHSEAVYCSHLITCNDQPFCFSPTERKFTVPKITDKQLPSIWSSSTTTLFCDKLKSDEDFVAQIGWYFYNYETEITPYDNGYKGEKFWEILFTSLPFTWNLAAAFVDHLKGMTEPESEASIMRKISSSEGRKIKYTRLKPNLSAWVQEFEAEGRPIARLYEEDGVHMVEPVYGLLNAPNFESDDLDLL